ncbi:MAG: DsbA family protein [Sulfuricaulis sp.]
MNMKPNHPLVIAIVIAITVIVVEVGYLMRQLASRPDTAQVVALIEQHLNAPGQTVPSPQKLNIPTEQDIDAMIDKRLAQQKPHELSEQEFNARVERGIIAFIDKQHRTAQDRPNQLAKKVPPPTKSDHIYGNLKAPVSLIEYSDFECPFCKIFHTTAKQLVDRSNGQVNWVYRHFPLDMHNPGATKEAEASECAAELGGNAVFWKFADAIYERTHSNGNGFPVANLVPLAVELGLNQEAFRQCLDSGRLASRIQHDIATGTKAGVQGTPGNILMNTRTGKVVSMQGAQPYESMSAAVQHLLKSP